ncbi:MAG: CrcB family protein [Phycisphaerales bacterium]|nr:CrcB family protein [Phycisphaerales bacterium]
MLTNVFLVALGGATGSVLRYLASLALVRWMGAQSPWPTAAINVLGCFVAGLVLGRLAGSPPDHALRSLLIVGVLGGFTTFSAFAGETVLLVQRGEVLGAMLGVGVSVVLCLGGAAAGHWLAA